MSGRISVLLAHDDPQPLASAVETTADDLSVTAVRSATAVLDGLDAADAVVSQYRLPDDDGLSLLRTVRQRAGDLPFVLCAGDGSERVASEAIGAGVTDYLPRARPAPEQVVETVVEAVGIHRARRREARRAGAVETTTSGVAIIDEDGQFVDVNEAYADIVGVEPDELLDENWQTVIPDDRTESISDEIEAELGRAGEWTGETVGRRADGSRYPKRFSAACLDGGGYVCVTRDITERKQRERERERTTALLSMLLNELPAGVLVTSSDREVVTVNERLLELFELDSTPQGLEGADAEALLVRLGQQFADPATFLDSVDRLVAGDREHLREELALADGRTFERSYRPIEVPCESCHLWVYRDITDRIERQAELVRQNDRLDEFASIVSHDLRGPLSVIDGSLSIAEETGEPANLDRCRRAVDRMDELLADLLSLARQGETIDETARVDLAAVVTDALATIGSQPADLRLRTDRTVQADRSRLQELLSNLLINAVEHGGESVTVVVGDLSDGFYVADDGSGIPPGDRDRVFDPGYSTAEDGTGFGLDIVARIATAHDWSLSVTTSDDGGARFEFRDVEAVP